MRGQCMVCYNVRQLVANEGEGRRVTGRIIPVGTCASCTARGRVVNNFFQAENSPWEFEATEPRITSDQAFEGEHIAFEQFCRWYREIIKRHYPDTDGVPLYLHNWYIVGKNDERARRLKENAWKRWRRVQAIYNRAYEQAEHRELHHDDYHPHWCAFCWPQPDPAGDPR